MKKCCLFIILNIVFLICNLFCSAQNRNTSGELNRTIDSLLVLLKNDKPDTNKVIHLYQLTREFQLTGDYQKGLNYGTEALDLAIILDFKKGMAQSTNNNGNIYLKQADYYHALDYYRKALNIDKEVRNKKGIAARSCNIGIVYKELGNYPKALDYYFEALKMDEELRDKGGIATDIGNIGLVYSEQDNYPKALNYYFKALKMAEELGYKNGIAADLGNIGIVYGNIGDHTKALVYFFKALKNAEELGDKSLIAILLGNIGNVYLNQGNYSKALNHYFKALKMKEKICDKNGIANTLGNIGSLYTKTGKFKEAGKYLIRAYAIDDSIHAMDNLLQIEDHLSRLYDTIGEHKLALIHYKKSIALKDTLFSQENKKQLIRKEMNYEFDKKESATKTENDKQQAVAMAESNKQKIIIWSVICGLLLVIVFAGFVFRSLRITRKQKQIIELQKNEVSIQKEIVERQKEKIVDSITYAQRIQQSILIEESEVQSYLSECFIYFQPKDIVSGDFYWCSKIDDKIIIAAVDCTGHGVPGAFMSMIGNTLLNQIVNEKRITKPSEILRLLNLGVYEVLHQQKVDALSDDGMDTALCCIDYKNNELQYAGQNPLYLLSNDQMEVIKGDIYGIGGRGAIAKLHNQLKKEFANHVIPIKKNMSIYLFSDGYMDQFGGDKRKKFGTQKFKELLLNNRHRSMQNQKELIKSAHIEWKGSSPQIDDILVIGIRI